MQVYHEFDDWFPYGEAPGPLLPPHPGHHKQFGGRGGDYDCGAAAGGIEAAADEDEPPLRFAGPLPTWGIDFPRRGISPLYPRTGDT